MDDARISRLTNALHERYGFRAISAAELELYVTIRGEADDWWAVLHHHWRAQHVPLLRIEKERGDHQYELVLGLNSPQGTADDLANLTRDIVSHAHTTMTTASFAAKPFDDQPASGLHLHVHLEDGSGANLFTKDDEHLSEPLAFALGGLMACMQLAYNHYCPHPEDAQRFADSDHVPRSLCWGVNNRYAALRIPTTQTMYDKHIELRVPSASANPHHAIAAMLASMLVGLDLRLLPPPQEYGKPKASFLNDLQSHTPDAAIITAFHALMV